MGDRRRGATDHHPPLYARGRRAQRQSTIQVPPLPRSSMGRFSTPPQIPTPPPTPPLGLATGADELAHAVALGLKPSGLRCRRPIRSHHGQQGGIFPRICGAQAKIVGENRRSHPAEAAAVTIVSRVCAASTPSTKPCSRSVSEKAFPAAALPRAGSPAGYQEIEGSIPWGVGRTPHR